MSSTQPTQQIPEPEAEADAADDALEEHDASAEETTEAPADRSEPLPAVPLDVLFDILKNRRRRLVLEYLAEADSTTSLSDLAEHIASIENDKPTNQLGSQERKRVYVGLYQCHLPRMHDSGAIEFDKSRGTVDPGPSIEQFNEYLDQPEPDPTPWSTYYLAHAAISTTLVGGAVLLFEAIVTAAFVVSIAGFAALSLVHASRSER